MNRKIEITILILLVLLVLGISLKVCINSRSYDCERCQIIFSHKMPIEEEYREFNYSIIKLYEGYLEDQCPVFWDKANGYMR